MKIRTRLLIDIEATYEDNQENTEETIRYCIEQDLQDIGYDVYNIKIFAKKEGEE